LAANALSLSALETSLVHRILNYIQFPDKEDEESFDEELGEEYELLLDESFEMKKKKDPKSKKGLEVGLELSEILDLYANYGHLNKLLREELIKFVSFFFFFLSYSTKWTQKTR
jgi:hypothetical protein